MEKAIAFFLLLIISASLVYLFVTHILLAIIKLVRQQQQLK
ncbi:MAG: hypothetical protein JG781_17 [Peptococcaceae bacterium]|jgi:hypothetical protein|nr:hypothetical protein [Peptococcaceae bacterium]